MLNRNANIFPFGRGFPGGVSRPARKYRRFFSTFATFFSLLLPKRVYGNSQAASGRFLSLSSDPIGAELAGEK
jgi:hypothetical protein